MTDASSRHALASAGARLRYSLLVVPEAPLMAVLLAVALAAGRPPLVALAIAALATVLLVRLAAQQLGRAALVAGRPRQAEALSELALALHPWSPDALALRAASALQAGDPRTAALALRRAARLDPSRVDLLAALSAALLEIGRYAEAEAVARRALLLDPRCAPAHLHLGEAVRAAGGSAESVEARLRAGLVTAHDCEVEAALHCALGRHLAEQGRLAEAQLALSRAEALLPLCSPAAGAQLRSRIGELTATQQDERLPALAAVPTPPAA